MKLSPQDIRQRLLPILLAQAIGLACGIGGVRLTSQWVRPADYGAYGIFITLALVGVSVIYAGLVKFISRHWAAAPDRPALLRAILAAALRKSIWLFAAAVCAALFVAPEHRFLYGALLLGCAALLALVQFAQSALQAARDHWRDLGLSAGMSITRSFAPPLLYSATGAGLAALLAGFLLHAAVGVLLGGWNLRRWWHPAIREAPAPILSPIYEGPRFVILAAVAWALAGVNRWIVAWCFGAETAGYFTLAGNIGAILPTLVGMMLLQYVQPQWFAAKADTAAARKQLLREVDRIAGLFTVVALVATFALDAAMPLLLGTLVDLRYADAIRFVLAAGGSATAVTIGLYYHAMLLASRRERACTVVDLSGAACLIVGGVVTAWVGVGWFKGWLLCSPAVPWLVNRPLARRAMFDVATASRSNEPTR